MRRTAYYWRWLYPAHCALCDRLLGRNEEGVCGYCREHMQTARYPFPGGFAPFPYKGIYRDAVRRFKYSGRPEYAAFFAEAIWKAYTGDGLCASPRGTMRQAWRPDVLIPVPIHRNRFRERGYNQAEELARELSLRIQVPCMPGLIIRKKDTLPQNGLDPDRRKENIRNAFAVRKGKKVPERILLVDDICTTGSTLRELERVLTARGAGEVRAVCVCLARHPFSFA